MKVALCVNKVESNRDINLQNIISVASDAIKDGAKFLVFPESCITGLINGRDTQKDKLLASGNDSK